METTEAVRKEQIVLDGDEFISLLKNGSVEGEDRVISIPREDWLTVMATVVENND